MDGLFTYGQFRPASVTEHRTPPSGVGEMVHLNALKIKMTSVSALERAVCLEPLLCCYIASVQLFQPR